MCQKHYLRVKATGTTDDPQPITHCVNGHEYTPENTYIDGLGKRHCEICRRAAKRAAYARETPPPCSVEDCVTPARKRGWCAFHHDRWKQYGDPLAGPPKRSFAKLPPDEKVQALRDAGRRYRERNPEKEKARWRAYKQAHPEQTRAQAMRWREENRAQWNALVYQARLRRLERIGPDPEHVDRRAVIAEFGMVCHICGGQIESGKDLEFDHVIPIARGGTESYDNIRPSHLRCNRRKGSKLMSELGGVSVVDALLGQPEQDEHSDGAAERHAPGAA